jgi:MFS family permease
MTRDLRLVGLSLLVWGVGEGMFFYFQPLYIQQLGADPVQIGAILGAAGLAMTVAHIPAGAIADHLGRRGVMVASWMTGTLAASVMFAARSLPVFVLGLLLYNTTAFVYAPMASYITAARGGWSPARALTTLSACYNMGSVLGPLVGGQVGERIGLRAAYGIGAVLFTASTILILFIRPQETEPQEGDSRYRALLKRRSFLGFLALAFAVAFALNLSWPLTPNFLQKVRGVSVGQIGVFGSLNAMGVVLLNLTLGRLAPRQGYLINQAAVGASVALLWKGTALPWYALGYFLAGGLRTARSLVTAQVESLVRQSEMGLAYGMAETLSSAALILAPPLAGLLYEREPALPFPVGLCLIALMFLVTARFAPASRSVPAAV